MPVTKGQYSVGVKQSGINIPDLKSGLEVAADAGQSIADSLFAIAAKKQEANFLQSFTEDSSKAYSDFQTQFPNDPTKMREAVENYSRTKIKTIAPAFQEYAIKYLAGKNSTIITGALNNHLKVLDQRKDVLYENGREGIKSEIGSDLDVLVFDAQDGKPFSKERAISVEQKFNQKNSNDISAFFESEFKGNPLKLKRTYTDLQTDSIKYASSLLYYKMRAYGEGEQSAMAEANNFNKTGSLFTDPETRKNLTITSQGLERLVKNPENRQKVFDEALKQYANFKNTTKDKLLNGATAITNVKIASVKNNETGTLSDIRMIKDHRSEYDNTPDLINKTFPGATQTQKVDISTHLEKQIKIHDVVMDINKGKDSSIFRLSEDEQKQAISEGLKLIGVNNPAELADPTNPNAAKAVNYVSKFKDQKYFDSMLSSTAFDINSPTLADDWRNKMSLAKTLIDNGAYNFSDHAFYSSAIELGLDAAGTNNEDLKFFINNSRKNPQQFQEKIVAMKNEFTTSGAFVKDLQNMYEDANETKWIIGQGIDMLWDNTLDLVGLGNLNTTRSESTKITNVDVLTKNMPGEADQFTFLPRVPFTGLPTIDPRVKSKLQEKLLFEYAKFNLPNPGDIFDEKYDKARQRAFNNVNRNLKANYTSFTEFGYSNTQGLDVDNKQMKYQEFSWEAAYPNQSSFMTRDAAAMDIISQYRALPDEEAKKDFFGINVKTGNPYTESEIISYIKRGNGVILEHVPNAFRNKKPLFRLKFRNPNDVILPVTPEGGFFETASTSRIIPDTKDTPYTIANYEVFAARNAAKETMELFKNDADAFGQNSKKTYDFISNVFYNIDLYKNKAIGFEVAIESKGIPWYQSAATFRPMYHILKAMGVDTTKMDDAKLKVQKYNDIDQKYFNKLRNEEKYTSKQTATGMANAIGAPYENPNTNYLAKLDYSNFATENYQDTRLPLQIRTNNYVSIHKNPNNNWVGQMDVKANKLAVFKNPSDSYRAFFINIMNKSFGSKTTKVEKQYGDQPKVSEIMKNYAENMSGYFDTIEQYTGFGKEDRISINNSEHMLKFAKAITIHEMGFDVYNKYYGGKDAHLLHMIQEGFNSALRDTDYR